MIIGPRIKTWDRLLTNYLARVEAYILNLYLLPNVNMSGERLMRIYPRARARENVNIASRFFRLTPTIPVAAVVGGV